MPLLRHDSLQSQKSCRLEVSSLPDQGLKQANTGRLHVFHDLNAYICTSNGCSFDTFSSRKLWYEHEQTVHLTTTTLQCQLCEETFETPGDFLHHAGSDHEMILDTANLKAAALNVATVARLKDASNLRCPLCLESG